MKQAILINDASCSPDPTAQGPEPRIRIANETGEGGADPKVGPRL